MYSEIVSMNIASSLCQLSGSAKLLLVLTSGSPTSSSVLPMSTLYVIQHHYIKVTLPTCIPPNPLSIPKPVSGKLKMGVSICITVPQLPLSQESASKTLSGQADPG